MFWSLVLPIKITFWSLVALVGVATAAAPALKWKRSKTFLFTLLVACVVFIPSCTGVMALIDSQRFGVFEYDSFADVQDFRVERYLPPSASSITIQKNSAGFRARFSITEADLVDYMDGMWTQFGHLSAEKRVDAKPDIHRGNDELGWPPLEDAVKHEGPRASNWAGFSIWYSPSEGIAYEEGSYW